MKANQIKWLRKELLFLKWLKIFFLKLKKSIESVVTKVDLYLSFIGFISFIYYIGFSYSIVTENNFQTFFKIAVWIFFISGIIELILFYDIYSTRRKILFIKVQYLFVVLLLISLNIEFIQVNFLMKFSFGIYLLMNVDLLNMLLIVLIFIRQISKKIVQVQHYFVNPAQLFAVSFIFIILFGSMLLLLPHSTKNGINLVDALFTSTSAVCVTGLTSVDTYSCFSELGKIFILLLIQIGGIGVVTFTGFFALFFRGNFSFKDQLMLKDILNKDQMTGILRFIYYVIFSTLIFEGIGASIIYFSTDSNLFPNNYQHWFFAVFHSVSAFCNAGFSNVDQGLSNIDFKYNYVIQMVIAFLIIFGGLGYSVFISLQHFIGNRLRSLIKKTRISDYEKNKIMRIDVSARLAIITTVILLLGGTTLFMYSEYNALLANFNFGEKLVVSFFSVVTPRTAGFNTYDFGLITNATCILIIFLMWIGASPGSTGGGIKTTTFSVAILNAISLGKGKKRMEIFKREIDVRSIRRAFSVIFMSIMMIFIGAMLVCYFDPNLPFRSVIFECFSALGTVGLSLGITTQLSVNSKIVIILLMYIGRIGTITLLVGFIKKLKIQNYRYCSEQILIN